MTKLFIEFNDNNIKLRAEGEPQSIIEKFHVLLFAENIVSLLEDLEKAEKEAQTNNLSIN